MTTALASSRDALPPPSWGRVGEGGSHPPSDNLQFTERT